MRPRRLLRPGARRLGAGSGMLVPPGVRQALGEARQHLLDGQPLQAAAIYDRLALEAYNHGRPRPGVQMDLEAARAFLAGGDAVSAQQRALRALRFVLQVGRPVSVLPLIGRIMVYLESQGQTAEAQQFRAEVDKLLGERGLAFDAVRQAAPVAPAKPGKLPGQCPACGAPLHPDELEWVGDDRVTCAFCGSIVVAE